MSEPLHVCVLVSGSGTNLQALLDAAATTNAFRVTRVIASRHGIQALERAARARVPGGVASGVGEDGPETLAAELEKGDAGLVVLAGWLKRVPGQVVRAWRGRMLNIHPALLPAFGGQGMYGHRVHEAVLAAGARVTGATVHFVDEEYDRGPIVAQWPVPVHEDDDPESLAARVLAVEHRLLPAVVEAFARGAVRLAADGPRWTRPWFPGEGFRMEGGPIEPSELE